jgi:DNA ligase (NAD+)
MSQERIQELVIAIKSAREAYYNLDPQISDQEFDALVDELKLLAPDHTEVKSVGAEPPQISVWEKVKHEIPMGSLNKANSEKEFEEWVKTTGVDSLERELHFTHKLDGSSMELIYQDGKLIKCITRGDGTIGEDVTYNIFQVPNIPKQIPVENAIVRGEIIMFKDMFKEKYAEHHANPRNTAAGKVRDKKGGGSDCANLKFLAYKLDTKYMWPTMELMFVKLQEMGFEIPPNTIDKLDTIKWLFNETSKKRDEIPYEIDGVVISVNDLLKQDSLGSLNMRPKGQIAWKFDPAMGVTTMLDVKWQVGNSGRVTPVASVAPVNVGGVTITSVSLHNISMFNDLKLFKGCRVLVARRNDVIPYIERNLDIDET